MKKATLRGLFALGPTFNKNVYEDKWQWLTPGTVWTGVAQPCPHSSATFAPCLCLATHGEVPWHRWTREASVMWGSRQSSQKSAGCPSVVSEQAHLGAYPHLNPKCERSGWPNQCFPFPPFEDHTIMAYPALQGPKRISAHN